MSSQKTIMLVDDDEIFVDATKIGLESKYNVETAKDGKECIEKVGTVKHDLIVLDIMMRHLGEGLDTSTQLKTDNATKDIPIIMLTGVSEVYDISTQVDKSQLKYDAWFEKPVDNDKLISEIEKLLAR